MIYDKDLLSELQFLQRRIDHIKRFYDIESSFLWPLPETYDYDVHSPESFVETYSKRFCDQG